MVEVFQATEEDSDVHDQDDPANDAAGEAEDVDEDTEE